MGWGVEGKKYFYYSLPVLTALILTILSLPIGAPAADIEMVFVKGGKFRMGCPDLAGAGCLADERPRHEVKLRSYAVPGYRTLNLGFRLALSP